MTTTNLSLFDSSPTDQVGITLNPDQQNAHDQLLSWLAGDIKAPFGVLKGFAGTGKSTTLGKIISAVKDRRMSVMVAAPTHKAVKVLRRNATAGVQYKTTHSALALKQQVNQSTGKITYEPDKFADKEPPIAGIKVLIHDESSMLSDELFNHLVPWIKKGLKVIFTGDPKQAPIIHNEKLNGQPFVKTAIPFRNAEAWNALILELNQPMRQADGNPILEFGTQLRSNLLEPNHHPQQNLLPNGSGIQLIEHASVAEHEIMERFFSSQQFQDDPDHFKVVCWRNVTVEHYNEIARSIIFKDVPNLSAIMLKEKLIMEKPYVVTTRQVVSTNEEVEVVECVLGTKTINYVDSWGGDYSETIQVYSVRVKYYTDDTELFARFIIVHESSEGKYLALYNKAKQWAIEAPGTIKGKMWKQYYSIEAAVAWVNYNYAISSHCSQGSTFDSALVLQWDFQVSKHIEERNMLLYVACTRARNTLFIET